ncbi:unnamed protein product [Rotaria sordida]|uniref:Carboxylic ester hydrolase n=2 Tax=Rotaria sordida TaxID=392033 RepID=A0A814P6J2_9BILA|nr:unnamed protein product [Rotaria sordida]
MIILVNLAFILVLSTQQLYANIPVIVHTQWKPPVPVPKWDPKVINATQPAPACSQPASPITSIRTPNTMSEDCLYLNIFTPLSSNSLSTSLLPVMIFIHGGHFQFGDASQSIYESGHLVNTTNIIIALIQYRLGVFGFLATGNGPNDLKGNYGILDQRLAIAWIKDNIDVFGGNPNEITLFGQSSGGQSTALHYVTSEMQPFFQRAIIQSAPMTIPFRTYSEYVIPGVLLAGQLHCTIGDVACFLTRSMDEIIAAQNAVNGMLTSLNFLLFFEPWLPVIDNVIVHDQLLNMVHNTSFPLKPLIIGTVTDECRDFIYRGWPHPISPSQYVELGLLIFREKAYKILKQYPPDGEGDQRSLAARSATHWVFACSTRVFA